MDRSALIAGGLPGVLLLWIFAAEVSEVSGLAPVCLTAFLAIYETMFETATATAASRPCK